jgi:hypothetical protein
MTGNSTIREKYQRKLVHPRHEFSTFAQCCQDLFVLQVLDHKKNGRYLEIGSGHPASSNNTYLLEIEYDWSGLGIEIDANLVKKHKEIRINECFEFDATIFDFERNMKLSNFPTQVDYLSLDIDPAKNTYSALLKIPFNRYRFSVITYEHDRYTGDRKYMDLSRAFLHSKGYQLVVANVNNRGRDFEDWWVDPEVVLEQNWRRFESSGLEFSQVFEKAGLTAPP